MAQNIYLVDLNVPVLKLASLLAQYLYAHKRLDLSGLGTFTLDPAVCIDPELVKVEKPGTIDGLSFENNSSVKGSDELIDFIASRSGKLRALAAADLDSHLELARQFLNIGKPFMFEGIGSLSKLKSGEFSFNPGQLITEKWKETAVRQIPVADPAEESLGDYKSILYLKKIKKRWKKPVVMVLILVVLTLSIWGGYTVYVKRGRIDRTARLVNPPQITAVAGEDTLTEKKDSLPVLPVSAPVAADDGMYKFIVETAGKERSLLRFGLLKGYGLPIRMETPDSVHYKLFFSLPAQVADTARLRDSLRRLYTPAGCVTFVER